MRGFVQAGVIAAGFAALVSAALVGSVPAGPVAQLAAVGAPTRPAAQQAPAGDDDLDARVQAFLESRRGQWHDLNVPEADGRTLHDLIVSKRFTRALEIGTSTGHSGLWIARALAKTAGRLITIEIDPDRHRTAVENFRAAGLERYVDARLADAHELVPQLEGPFDFVFSDADKDWYTNYFTAVWPRVVPGGCFTAHNVGNARMPGIREFLAHVAALPDGTTTFDRTTSAGLSMTCKTG